MRRPLRGFTLIELLVVVAIILALAGLTFTFVKRGMQAAYAARCINNLKQICNAQNSIPDDTGGFFLHGSRTEIDGRQRNFSMHLTVHQHDDLAYTDSWSDINERVTSLQMLNCPAAYAKAKTQMADVEGQARWRTYALNNRIGLAQGQTTEDGAAVDGVARPDQLEAPSMTICAGETTVNNAGRYRTNFGPGSARPSQVGMADHHSGGFHIGYMDGHVQYHRLEEFPYQGNTMPDGRLVRYNAGNNSNANDAHWSIVWRGQRFKRFIPNP